jgi:hypothetical protein
MWRRLDRESGLRCTRSALSNQDSMSLKNREKLEVKRNMPDCRAVFPETFHLSPFTIHVSRLRSAANGQSNNRALFTAGPALCPIGKCQTE